MMQFCFNMKYAFWQCRTETLWCKVEKTERRKPKLKWVTVTPAQILVSNTIKPLMAALRHKRTRAGLLRTDMREFINRKQRGPVRESERLTDWDEVRGTAPPPPPFPPFFSSITPTTLPRVRQLLSPQNPPALFPDEAPIRPMKPDPGLLMEPVKYHRFKNPCVINILGSPASIQIIPFSNTWLQYMQKYHIDVHHRLRHMTHPNKVARDKVGYMEKERADALKETISN